MLGIPKCWESVLDAEPEPSTAQPLPQRVSAASLTNLGGGNAALARKAL